MKYILIEYDDDGANRVRIFETAIARELATRLAINGDTTSPCHELDTLDSDGIVEFEGEPPIEWLTAYVAFA